MSENTLVVHSPESALAVARDEPNAQRSMRLLRPVAQPADIIAAQEETRALIERALVEGRDWGKIPGVDKPSLLKPGAERIALGFGCMARFTVVEREADHDREVKWIKRKKKWRNAHPGDRESTWIEESGVSLGLYRYVIQCDIVERASGEIVGSCLGACSTLESKYIDRPRDAENTALKMAEKRALVGAVLVTFGLSDQFTQDLEESGHSSAPAAEPTPPLTRESQVPWGRVKGTAVKDLAVPYLVWAVEEGRKLGQDTEKWQAIMREELEVRKAAQAKESAPTIAEQTDEEIREEEKALLRAEEGR